VDAFRHSVCSLLSIWRSLRPSPLAQSSTKFVIYGGQVGLEHLTFTSLVFPKTPWFASFHHESCTCHGANCAAMCTAGMQPGMNGNDISKVILGIRHPNTYRTFHETSGLAVFDTG
jgi:hypothetical protein